MKRNTLPQFELPGAESVFSLYGQSGLDGDRVVRERQDEAARRRASEDFAARMQRTFEQCPGFVGADCPTCPESTGRVVVEPGRISEAMPWLKRRFHVNETWSCLVIPVWLSR